VRAATASPLSEGAEAEEGDGEGDQLVAGERAPETRGVAKEFMNETETTITDEIDVKMLRGPNVAATQQNEQQHDQTIEEDFNRGGRPSVHAGAVGNCVPMRRTDPSKATAVQPAADASHNDAEGRDGGEPIAGGLGVAHPPFG